MSKARLNKSRSRSDDTRALIKQKALKQGQKRTEAVEVAVRAAMRIIEREIEGNAGIYPGNKGGLSLNEVARRASVHNTTLFGPKYDDLHASVTQWIKDIKSTAVTGRVRVKREYAQRVAEWRELYDGLVESHRVTELDLQEAQRKLEDSMKERERLAKENAHLLKALNAATTGKIVPLRSTKQE